MLMHSDGSPDAIAATTSEQQQQMASYASLVHQLNSQDLADRLQGGPAKVAASSTTMSQLVYRPAAELADIQAAEQPEQLHADEQNGPDPASATEDLQLLDQQAGLVIMQQQQQKDQEEKQQEALHHSRQMLQTPYPLHASHANHEQQHHHRAHEQDHPRELLDDPQHASANNTSADLTPADAPRLVACTLMKNEVPLSNSAFA